jgi:hypothetical protein
MLACTQRGAISRDYGIQGNACNDCVYMYFCSCCVLAQQRREQLLRGPAGPPFAAPMQTMQPPNTLNSMPISEPAGLGWQQQQPQMQSKSSWQQQPQPQHPYMPQYNPAAQSGAGYPPASY